MSFLNDTKEEKRKKLNVIYILLQSLRERNTLECIKYGNNFKWIIKIENTKKNEL